MSYFFNNMFSIFCYPFLFLISIILYFKISFRYWINGKKSEFKLFFNSKENIFITKDIYGCQ